MEENTLVEDLLEQARRIIERRYRKGYHEVGAAIHTRSGRTYAAVHLEANVGRIAVCAEAVALGMAAAEGDTEADYVVAVNSKGEVVSPCGMCRELIADYSPHAKIIVRRQTGTP
ncbi:MAG: cytidine deaminase [Deltaproteobacteria bacterium]|nr:cytidine deaminase [Deltaproteobacteria bacterium]